MRRAEVSKNERGLRRKKKKTEKKGKDRNGGIRLNRILFIGMKINRVHREQDT